MNDNLNYINLKNRCLISTLNLKNRSMINTLEFEIGQTKTYIWLKDKIISFENKFNLMAL